MPETASLSHFFADSAVDFITQATSAKTTTHIEALLARLPITSEHDFIYDSEDRTKGWQQGKLHWIPVGLDRGNSGRIKQANTPINPIAERAVNAMEAMIELARQRELAKDSKAGAPATPRAAVQRYFSLPPLDQIPKIAEPAARNATREAAREVARHIRVSLTYDKPLRQFAVSIADEGIGQAPARIHRTLLSLGSTTKADKWYLIGVFGQGGSSAFAVSQYSWLVSRRAPDLLDGETDGVGWTIIKHVFPKNRRDDYFAYLAATPEGHVPTVSEADADAAGIGHGTRFSHIAYDFGRGGSAITRQLFQSLNHILYNPVLPFDTDVAGTVATVYGNGYRLSSLGARGAQRQAALDKQFPPQVVGA